LSKNPHSVVWFGNYEGVYSAVLRASFSVDFVKNSTAASCTLFNDILSNSLITHETISLNNEQFSVARTTDKSPDSELQTTAYRILKHGTCFELRTSLYTIPKFVEQNYDNAADKKREFEKYLNEIAYSFKVF
jgi:hypothetical protein